MFCSKMYKITTNLQHGLAGVGGGGNIKRREHIPLAQFSIVYDFMN